MRTVPTSLQSAWADGLFVGDRKATARVTVQHPRMKLYNYALLPIGVERKIATLKTVRERAKVFDKKHVDQTYADFLFHNTAQPKELPNVRSVEWSRSIDSDVANCTITLWNNISPGLSDTLTQSDLDFPGFFTYDRGATNFGKSRWGHVRNQFFGLLVPDNIICTFEGYGANFDHPPETDPNLCQTGVWMIDTVTVSADATMSIKCRDVGRLLLDQLCVKPLVPDDFYNEPFGAWPGPTATTTTTKLKVKASDSSNTPWIGNSLTHSVQGHKLQYAFDGNPNTYWLSIGNVAPSRRFAYEWVQASVGNQSVSEVRFRTKKKGYTAYISLKVGGQWIGTQTINYHEDGIGMNGGDIKYYRHASVPTEEFVTVKFPPVAKVQAIRVTLGNLQNFAGFGTYHYRGAIRDVEVYGVTTGTKPAKTGPAGSNPGYYRDYTDIVKLLCAWGGFFWPTDGAWRISDGSYLDVKCPKPDTKVLGKGVKGAIWGNLQDAGVAGEADLGWDNFDQKPLMDGISYIRDILGFIFYIDELGGVQWRLPNTFDFGSVAGTLDGILKRVKPHVIDERTILLSLDSTVSSKNVREMVFVGTGEGDIGAYAPGFNPNPTGMRRVGGYTDVNFANNKECERMADMISLAELFTYRTDRVRIPANPKIQVDDQVRILERISAEGYIHYIKGISSSLDVTTGEWTYDLDTHWLGMDPKTQWVFTPKQLAPQTTELIETQLNLQAQMGIDRTPKGRP